MSSTSRCVYLDHHATTPCAPEVLAAMWPYFGERFGNAASTTHGYGRDAARAVAVARLEVAELIGASPKEIIFTSGATEALNLAITGLARAQPERRQIIISAVEHEAVRETCAALAADEGAEITVVGVQPDGRIDPAAVFAALRPGQTLCVCVMAANNEIGTVQPLAPLGQALLERGVPLVSDAAQAAGKVPLSVEDTGAALVALSSHKLYGPKGVGALYVRRRPPVHVKPLLFGGGHERGLRSGTLPVPLIVGFGAAAALAGREMAADAAHLGRLRDRLLARLRAVAPDLVINGTMAERLPHNLNIAVPGVEGRRLIDLVQGQVALSSGSACTSAALQPSHVLEAIGMPPHLAYSALRFGLGRGQAEADIDRAADALTAAITQLRGR